LLPGTAAEPGIALESVHHIMKTVAGAPNLRPAWFFDIREQGEALSDVGTHLVDLAQWTAFPEQAIDYRADIGILEARRWPTTITRPQFRQVTNEPDFPVYLEEFVRGDRLEYFCNNFVHYTLRGVHVTLNVLWNWEAPPGGGDVYLATFRGTRSRSEIRQGVREGYRPELYFVPNEASLRGPVFGALRGKVVALAERYPGIAVEELGEEARIAIPDRHRVGHEAHFAQVTNRFFQYLKSPAAFPAWENPNMLAKYCVSTRGVELSHEQGAPLAH
jgi:predicted dehydrogenase